MNRARAFPAVLTLDEAADYLRIPRTTIERLAPLGQIPCRRIEKKWRFSRPALDDWLRGDWQEAAPKPGGSVVVHAREGGGTALERRERMIDQAGRLAHDTTLEPMLRAIYAERGRAVENWVDN